LHSPPPATAGARGQPGGTVYLARHATPDWSRTDLVYHLLPGPPLTVRGEAEASDLGRFLRDGGVGQIWTSPLDRARRTAELAATVSGAQVTEDARLMEMRPDETHDDVYARARPVWEAAVAAATRVPQAVVAHGGVVTAVMLAIGVAPTALARVGRRFDGGNPLPPGGAWEITGPAGGGVLTARLVFVPSQDPVAGPG
jgi:2,3-bisphosphoglycerate-dependent phosphoglycerate mutase